MEFSWINGWGAMIVIIMLVPNIIFGIKNPYLENKCENVIMNTIEQVGRYTSMILMIVPVLVEKFDFKSVFEMIFYIVVTSALLLLYLLVWFFYLKSQSTNKSILLALLPTMIFVISGILLRHWLLMIAGILFGIGHIFVTLQNSKR
ncbi:MULTISPECIES: hypothetical protein [Clostridia]|jgi:hypothetical protein|uniref:hypothetical protein n=1 Tax=Clostridia TaxID=186801 RepID=UPI000EB5414F|nr:MULTISPECIES: hypothetical protein [Clostridia]RKQ22666.1 hypothetical protein D8Q48_16415 [Ruminococcus sp. B05]TAP25555.1 hypothetical protein EYA86_16285 [Mediterraneibacter sp. gm002]